MTTGLFSHKACLLHDNGPGHPESPDRLKAILHELAKPQFSSLSWADAPPATLDQIARVHDRPYIESVFEHIPKEGRRAFDQETSLVPESGEAALRAAGALIAAVDAVMEGRIKNAFCAVRPPGHHAAVPPTSGFCLFNNIAVGAAYALATHNVKRIAIVDFDVHHGNGTQAWAETEKRVLFFSSHQSPLWPGSGTRDEKGIYKNIINIPLAPGTDSEGFRSAMRTHVLPAIEAYAPELIMISAGFDAHGRDPLANLRFTTEDFGWITTELCALAHTHCKDRIVSTLEGGYDLEALANSVAAHVRAMLDA